MSFAAGLIRSWKERSIFHISILKRVQNLVYIIGESHVSTGEWNTRFVEIVTVLRAT